MNLRFSLTMALAALAFPITASSQDEIPPEGVPDIEIRGRSWQVIQNGEQETSERTGTDFGKRNVLDGYKQSVFYILNRGDGELELGNSADPEAPAVVLSGDGAMPL